jgi:hypothetical protein
MMSVTMSVKEISSVFVELVLHFILFEELDIAPLPKVMSCLFALCSPHGSGVIRQRTNAQHILSDLREALA